MAQMPKLNDKLTSTDQGGTMKSLPVGAPAFPGPDKSLPLFILRMRQERCAHPRWRSTIMRAASLPLLVSFSRYSVADRSHSICAHSTRAVAPLRQDRAGMYTGGLCSQRGQEWSWDHVRLYPADHARDTKEPGLAANRFADRGGVQGTGAELRKGVRTQSGT